MICMNCIHRQDHLCTIFNDDSIVEFAEECPHYAPEYDESSDYPNKFKKSKRRN